MSFSILDECASDVWANIAENKKIQKNWVKAQVCADHGGYF